jgi:deoxyxylulose-5-phosphate synthase
MDALLVDGEILAHQSEHVHHVFFAELAEILGGALWRARPRHIVRRGIPDRFIEHGERAELLADLGLHSAGLCRTVKQSLERPQGLAVESEY